MMRWILKYQTTLEVLAGFCFSLFLFSWGQASQEVIGFESRFYLFALEMWHDGITWFPQTYQQPYPDYPVTSTLLIYLFAKVIGQLNKLIALFPSALAASGTMVMTYLIASLHSKRWGLFALFFMLCTITFLKSARSIGLDLYPTLAVACCFYLIYSADILKKPSRSAWVYLFFLLGFLFRGPIGLIMPAGVTCTYYLFNKNFKRFFQMGFIALSILILCSVAFLGIAYHVGGNSLVYEVIRMQILLRMDSDYFPVYFYFITSLGNYAIVYPMAGVILVGMIYASFKTEDPSNEFKCLWKLFGWVMIILCGMSIPGDKKIRYILPIVPALSLIAAFPFVFDKETKYFNYLKRSLIHFFLFLPAILFFGIGLVSHQGANGMFAFLTIMQCVNGIYYHFLKRYEKKEIMIVANAALSFVITYIAIVEPILIHIDRARDFVVMIEKERIRQHARLVFLQERPDGLPIKYLIHMAKLERPVFIDDLHPMDKSFFITRETYFANLPDKLKSTFNIIGKDRMGHINVVVFTQK